MKERCIMNIDFNNEVELRKLMERHEEFPCALFSRNDDDELVMVSICEEYIVMSTFQNNNFERKNIYHKDGTIEELFEKWE